MIIHRKAKIRMTVLQESVFFCLARVIALVETSGRNALFILEDLIVRYSKME